VSGLVRRLAQVSAPVESETPFGGRTTVWETVGPVWLALKPPRFSERNGEGQRPRQVEQREAEARFDPLVERGQRVSIDGADYAVLHVAADAPMLGRMILTLERETP
jgi:hypothetical protein